MPFGASYAALCLVQAATVAAVGRTLEAPWRSARARLWALVPPVSIVAVVVAVRAASGTATVLTDAALVLVPIGAGIALGWVLPRSRPAFVGLAPALLAVAWAAKGSAGGDVAAVALTALSAAAAGALLAALAPAAWLEIGILLMAAADVALVVSDLLQAPNAVLNAAAPPGGAPQLQRLHLSGAVMGYGDVFVAGVLGAVLRRADRSPAPAALGAGLGALAFGTLFWVADELPATVPVAAAMVVDRLLRARRRGR